MELVVVDTKDSVARESASRIQKLVTQRPSAHIGLATGATQQGIYRLLIDAHQRGDVSFDQVKFFMLDEYVGVPPTSTTSFQHVLTRHFLEKIAVPDHALEILDGMAHDLDAEAQRFEDRLVASGGLDLQMLGIGTNGHIGFNEPGSDFSSRTRVVSLHPDTIRSNALYFDSEDVVPRTALSQGIGTIMEARSILLMATGPSKARAIASLVQGPVTTECPASILTTHPDVTVIVDSAAASLLEGQRPEVAGLSVQA